MAAANLFLTVGLMAETTEQLDIHSFIQYSVWRQVQSLLQNDSSKYCDLELPPSNESILSCP